MLFRLTFLLAVAHVLFATHLRAEDVPKSGILVLDDADPDFKDKEAYADNLSYIGTDGKLDFQIVRPK